MSNLIKWPFTDTLPSMKNLVEDFWLDTPDFFNRMLKTGTTIPAANLKETEQAYEIELAVPGLKKEDIKIQLDKHRLTVSAETKTEQAEKAENYSRREYAFSSFSRSFNLPEDVNQDAIGAEYNNGVLHLNVPRVAKTQAESSRDITIK